MADPKLMRNVYTRLYREILSSLKSTNGRYSGQQQAYAKGRAWKRMKELGY